LGVGGAGCCQAGCRAGADRETVVRHLIRAGVQLRRLGLTEEQAMAAKRLYLDG
jgi:hypothetical protein